MDKIQCSICGEWFEPYNSNDVVCSDVCRNERKRILAFYRREERRRKEESKDKYCKYCGCLFHSYLPQKIYCSEECAKKSHLKDMRDKQKEYLLLGIKPRKKVKKESNAQSIARICREAKEHGMSYGEYVVFLDRQKEKV